MDLADVHAAALEHTEGIVAAIEARQWQLPTPCSEWDVRTVAAHIVRENLWVAPLVDGRTIDEVGDRFEGDVLGGDAVSAYQRSARTASHAFFQPGALDRAVHLSYGDVPGAVYCGHRIIDVVVHGWDLARGTGQDEVMPVELAEACWGIVEPQLDQLGGSGVFGPPVAVGSSAGAQDRLLGALGRRP